MSYVNDHQAIVNTQGIRTVKRLHRKEYHGKTQDGKEFTSSEAWLVEIAYKGDSITYSFGNAEEALNLFAAIVKALGSKHVLAENNA